MNDLESVRWLLEHRPPPQPLLGHLLGLRLAVVDVGDGHVHVYNGCKTSTRVRPRLTEPAPAELDRVTLGEVLEQDPDQMCAMCLHLWMEYGVRFSPADKPQLPNLVHALPRLGRAMAQMTHAAACQDLAFHEVPWSHLLHVLPWSLDPTGKQPREHMQAQLVRCQRQLIEHLSRRWPHWLHVRYAAGAARQHEAQTWRGSDHARAVLRDLASGRSPWPDGQEPPPEDLEVLDRLVEDARQALAEDPLVPVVVSSRRDSRVALGSRHLIEVEEEIGSTLLLAIPRRWAHAVDAEDVTHGWLDLADGWTDDELTRQRVRTAVTLWEGRADGAYPTLDEGWQAALRLHPATAHTA